MTRRRQFLVYILLSALAVGLTAIAMPSAGVYFRRYYGGVNPLLVVGAATAVGGASLALLTSRGWFAILKGRTSLRGMLVAGGLATGLAVAIVIADLFIRYPEDMNVPLPQALLFYPAIGFVAEIVFHVVPLTLLLMILAPLGGRMGGQRLVWLCLGLVAVAEPIFQVGFDKEIRSWAAAYTGVHVLAISILQLYIFWRYDFVTLYFMRLFYYAYWHIAWGTIRLEVLF